MVNAEHENLIYKATDEFMARKIWHRIPIYSMIVVFEIASIAVFFMGGIGFLSGLELKEALLIPLLFIVISLLMWQVYYLVAKQKLMKQIMKIMPKGIEENEVRLIVNKELKNWGKS